MDFNLQPHSLSPALYKTYRKKEQDFILLTFIRISYIFTQNDKQRIFCVSMRDFVLLQQRKMKK
jgi:hypothetical protein